MQRPVVGGHTHIEGTEWWSWSGGKRVKHEPCAGRAGQAAQTLRELASATVRFAFPKISSVHGEEGPGGSERGAV